MFRRLLVVGSPGAGKSTLARRLGPRLSLPVIHLDQHYWNPGWRPTPDDEWHRRLDELLAEPAWILDGNYHATLPRRLQFADAVLFLDLPAWRCRWRVARRIATTFGRTRADLAPGCPEQIDVEFLRWTWNWPRDIRPHVIRAMDAADPSVRRWTLRSPAEVEAFEASLAG